MLLIYSIHLWVSSILLWYNEGSLVANNSIQPPFAYSATLQILPHKNERWTKIDSCSKKRVLGYKQGWKQFKLNLINF